MLPCYWATGGWQLGNCYLQHITQWYTYKLLNLALIAPTMMELLANKSVAAAADAAVDAAADAAAADNKLKT